jgi:hypothetical protein
VHRLDVEEFADADGIGPVQEVAHGPKIRFARVAVSDLCGEELQEAFFGLTPARTISAGIPDALPALSRTPEVALTSSPMSSPRQ